VIRADLTLVPDPAADPDDGVSRAVAPARWSEPDVGESPGNASSAEEGAPSPCPPIDGHLGGALVAALHQHRALTSGTDCDPEGQSSRAKASRGQPAQTLGPEPIIG
jgi:hypothetical protein